MVGEQHEDLDLLLARAAAMDYQSQERWDIVGEMRRRTDRTAFAAVCALARSGPVGEQVLGLDILGQFGYPQDRPFAEEALQVLVVACDDTRPEILDSAITSLGHLADPRALAAVVRHRAHHADMVRFAVAFALPAIAGDPPASEAVEALILLTGDPDLEVRDWATFGLGSQIEFDSRPVRQALAARLDDSGGDTTGEALVGLARRGDPRALPVLLTRLRENPDGLIVEAAAALGSAAALPALRQLKLDDWQQDDLRPWLLDDAISACSR